MLQEEKSPLNKDRDYALTTEHIAALLRENHQNPTERGHTGCDGVKSRDWQINGIGLEIG